MCEPNCETKCELKCETEYDVQILSRVYMLSG